MGIGKILVVSAALLSRLMPIAIGFLVATIFGARSYADAVLLITAANLSGSLPTLAVTPLVIRCSDNNEAITLATRGVIVGAAVILVATACISQYLKIPGAWVFLLTYTCAVFVLGVSLAVHNQQMRNLAALWHAGLVSVLSLGAAMCSLLFSFKSHTFLATLGISMLVISMVSFLTLHLHRRATETKPLVNSLGSAKLSDALLSGMFSLLVIAGLFLSNLRARNTGDPEGIIAFAVGLQVFSVVVFVPSALSSHFIPALVRAGEASTKGMLVAAQRTYLMLGVPMCLVALAASPLLFRYLHVSFAGPNFLTFGLIQVAALLAAINAAYNQVWASLGRFSLMAGLNAIWLLSVLASQAILGGGTVMVSLSLVVGYAVLMVAAVHTSSRVIRT